MTRRTQAAREALLVALRDTSVRPVDRLRALAGLPAPLRKRYGDRYAELRGTLKAAEAIAALAAEIEAESA